jgi:hypothetical protein
MCIPAAIFEYEEEMKTFLILGQNPSGAKAFKNNTIDRLSKWLDYAGITDYDFDNVSRDLGEKFKVDLDRVKMLSKGYSKIVALGRVASNTLHKLDIPHLYMPHPSPRNRQLNSKEFEKEKMNSLKNYADEMY